MLNFHAYRSIAKPAPVTPAAPKWCVIESPDGHIFATVRAVPADMERWLRTHRYCYAKMTQAETERACTFRVFGKLNELSIGRIIHEIA